MILRYYQADAKQAVYDHLQKRDDNPCVVIPTGGGKTPLLASICNDVHTLWQGRAMILAHVRELLEQARDKIILTNPFLPVGVYSAGLKSREKRMPITIAGIHSVYKRACEFDPFDLIIVDEAHLIPADGQGMYQTFLKDAKIVNPNLRIIGLTATPYRLDVGEICGPENILNEICYEVGVKELIRDGFLCRVKSRAGAKRADLSGVHVRGGEFIADEMSAAFDQDSLVDSACREIIELSEGRKGILVFCSSIAHGQHVQAKLKELGQIPGFVCGETPDDERDELIGAFKAQRLRWMVNVNVLTTGFDAEHIDCVALLRGTLSPGLYYQMVGRGFRLFPEKKDCLILDYGSNIERHGPVDSIKRKRKGGSGSGVTPVRECPGCHCLIHAGYSACPECNYVFPSTRDANHGTKASGAGVISGETTDTEHQVRKIRYTLHRKRNADDEAPPTLRVDYSIGWEKWQSEWVCIEHQGFARRKAEQWWKARSEVPIPNTVEEAILLANAGALAVPKSITVRETAGEKFDRIIKAEIEEVFTPGECWEPPLANLEQETFEIPF